MNKEESSDIERVQKAFLHGALGQTYTSYEHALDVSKLETLESRIESLCLNFAKKAAKHPKNRQWFVETDPNAPDTR